MLQGHDPLIIEKTTKGEAESQKVVSLSSHFTTHSNTKKEGKENAAFRAQSSTKKDEEEETGSEEEG